MGEHLPCKQGVMGSNPIISTTRQCREPNFGKVQSVNSGVFKRSKKHEGSESFFHEEETSILKNRTLKGS